jgi:hypothetical protein
MYIALPIRILRKETMESLPCGLPGCGNGGQITSPFKAGLTKTD